MGLIWDALTFENETCWLIFAEPESAVHDGFYTLYSILCYLCTRFHENGHGFHGKLQQSYTGSIPQVVTQLYIAVVAHRLLQLIAPFQWKNPHFKIPTTIVTH